MKITKKYQLDQLALDRIIEMAWEDRTPFEAIEAQFGIPEGDVIQIMRREMHPRNFKKWRARVQGRSTKHKRKGPPTALRFKSSRQKQITGNRISKR